MFPCLVMLLDVTVNKAWGFMLAHSTTVSLEVHRGGGLVLKGPCSSNCGLQLGQNWDAGAQSARLLLWEQQHLCLPLSGLRPGWLLYLQMGEPGIPGSLWPTAGQLLSWLIYWKDWEKSTETTGSRAKVVPVQAGLHFLLPKGAQWGLGTCFLHRAGCLVKQQGYTYHWK